MTYCALTLLLDAYSTKIKQEMGDKQIEKEEGRIEIKEIMDVVWIVIGIK